MLEGHDEIVGVAGNTFTEELWGLRPLRLGATVGEATDVVVEDVDEALECVW
jgi:hypothetical protein